MNKQTSFPFGMPVEWRSPNEVQGLMRGTADWLLNTGSLTERLQALTTMFEVELLGQSQVELDKTEQEILATCSPQRWQVREVLLKGSSPLINNNKQQNWVFARSVLPDELCNSQWANLGNQPLGKRIFNDTSFVRSDFEIGCLAYHPITGDNFSKDEQYWARRSKFKIGKFELLVAEAFLPHSPCYW